MTLVTRTRHQLGLLLVAAVALLLVCGSVDAAATETKTPSSYSLRSAADEEGSNQDRAFDVSAKLEGVATSVKQWRTNYLFKKFKVGSIEANVLGSSEFERWASAVAKLNNHNADAASLQMAKKLSARFGDDELAAMIIAAKKTSGLETTAGTMEQAQLVNWLAKKTTADDALTLLQLNGKSGNVITNSEFGTWMTYVAKLPEVKASNNRFAAEKLMVSTLVSHYGDDGVASMIMAAKKAPGMEATVEKLENVLLSIWFAKKKSADEVFKLLQVRGETVESVIKSPEFFTWMAYVNKLDEKNPLKFTAVKVLTEKYDEVEVLMAVASVAKSPNPKDPDTQALAKYMQDMLFDK